VSQALLSLLEGVYHLFVTPVDLPSLDLSLINERRVAPRRAPVRGLAVTANNRDDVETLAVGLASAHVLTPEFPAGAAVSTNETRAFIGAGAAVNQGATGADPSQTVLVAAGSDVSAEHIAGVLSDANIAGLGASMNVTLSNNRTEAFI